jgi:hypothetical protein
LAARSAGGAQHDQILNESGTRAAGARRRYEAGADQPEDRAARHAQHTFDVADAEVRTRG